MGKWYVVDSRDNRIFESSSDWCQYAAGPGFAAAIVERHNEDIDQLTARAEAAEYRLEHPPLAENQDDLARICYEAYMSYILPDSFQPWLDLDTWDCYGWRLAANAVRAAVEAERDELRRRIDAVLAMLHLSSSTIHDNWVGYCSACWWRGDARCADWAEDSSGGMQPECPICGESVDEIPSYTHSVAFYEHAKAIAEGRDHE